MKPSDGDIAVFLDRYDWRDPWRAVSEESGMNNTTLMVYAGEERFVLRLYDNHRDEQIVRIEHEVLRVLGAAPMSIRVPMPVANNQGVTVTANAEGKLAALYRFIEGHRPTADNPSHVEGFGEAAGSLAHVLQNSRIEAVTIYDPYYRFEQTHQAMTENVLRQLCIDHELTKTHIEQVEAMLRHRKALEALVPAIEQLPQQWIHGDIVFTNSVAQGDRIVGLLDFEFTTIDVRAMELAVVLAEFPEADAHLSLSRMERFCRGYGSKMKLSQEELTYIPDLIKLRMLDVFLHFAGRLSEGLDPASVWAHQIERNSYVCEWVERHRLALASIFDQYLRA